MHFWGPSLAVQWLRLRTSNAGGAGSIPAWGTKTPHDVRCGAAKKLQKFLKCIPRKDDYIF